MATQTYVTDMQAINAAQQTTTQSQNSGQVTGQVVKSGGQGQTATILQPSQAHSGQQFIVTSKFLTGEQSGEQQDTSGVQLQQQQNSSNQVVYQPQQGGGYEYQQGATMYAAPVSGTYYQSAATPQMGGFAQVGGIQGQLLTHQGNTYLVQGGTMDGEGHPLTHTTRASPATVQWLIENYETAEGVSLPRSTLYNHYLRHCQEQKIDPMNPASFGKLIRSVFLGLRTRRLGTRGNSKYHYYGIRIKASSPLNQYTDEMTMAMRQQPMNQGKRFKTGDGQEGYQDGWQPTTQQHQHQQFLGDASSAIPQFTQIEMENEPCPPGISIADLTEFEELYKEHCEAILDIVVNLQFSLIEALWQSFWRNLDNESENLPVCSGDIDEHRLSKEKLYALCRMPQVRKFVRHSDYAFYQALVEVLIPDVLRPIPSSLTQAIRNFAKSLENWLKNSTEGIPDEMVKTKINAVSAFAQTLRRYTSLNHLAQAARAVLQNTTQINQMLTDLNRVDFTNVQEQASWVCQCDDEVVHRLEQDFKKTLQQQNSLEQWAVWLEGVVHQVLTPYEGKDNFPKAARQFLLKWSFYSSMVIRDLTLRSAASFGSFHLIRLLYDEYMFYLVEHKVANATGETPIAVMGEFIDFRPTAMSLGTSETDTKPIKPVTTAPTIAIPTTKLSLPTLNGQANIQTMSSTPKSTIIVAPAGTTNHALSQLSSHIANSVHTHGSSQALHVVNNAKPVTTAPTIAVPTAKFSAQALNSQANIQTVSGTPKSTIIVAPAGTTNHALSQLSSHIANSVHTHGVGQGLHVVNNTNTVTVVSSSGTTTQPKTLVVLPVSGTTPGGGDAQPAKKLKSI